MYSSPGVVRGSRSRRRRRSVARRPSRYAARSGVCRSGAARTPRRARSGRRIGRHRSPPPHVRPACRCAPAAAPGEEVTQSPRISLALRAYERAGESSLGLTGRATPPAPPMSTSALASNDGADRRVRLPDRGWCSARHRSAVVLRPGSMSPSSTPVCAARSLLAGTWACASFPTNGAGSCRGRRRCVVCWWPTERHPRSTTAVTARAGRVATGMGLDASGDGHHHPRSCEPLLIVTVVPARSGAACPARNWHLAGNTYVTRVGDRAIQVSVITSGKAPDANPHVVHGASE